MKAASGSTLAPKRGAHTVVLGCAKAQRGFMAPLIEAFAAQEHHVELVSGVDESRQRWREAGQRCGMRAVYVACGGPMLPPAELTALRDELLSIGIPATSILATVVEWSQVDRLIRDVERMMDAAPLVVPAPPPLTSVRELGPSNIAPMMPPAPPRLAPVGPSHGHGSMSLAPELIDDGTSGSLDLVDPFPDPRSSARRRMAIALGTVAVAGLLVLAGLVSTNDDDAPAIATAAVEGSVAGQQTPPSSRTVAPPAEGKAAEGKAAEGKAAKGKAAKGKAAEGPSPAPEQPDELSDDALVHAALMQRKIRALDILLVSPEAVRQWKQRSLSRHMSWAAAHDYCDALDIGGVKGWRLPTVGEFRTLSTSNMLERRSYWSATEADAFGSDRVVWNNLKKTMAPAPAAWKDGRVLCVRFQHPEAMPPS